MGSSHFSRNTAAPARFGTRPESGEMVSMRWVVAVDKRGTEEVGGIAAGWLPESFPELQLARACEHSDGRQELEKCQIARDSRGKENSEEMRWCT
ncbi:hypothetical protein SLA2020_086250 [Shorea laevis]